MASDDFDDVGELIGDSIDKLRGASSAMADAMDESVRILRRAVKRSGDVAEELMDDTTDRIKRHPVETITMSFMAGVVVGVIIGWALGRK